LTNFDFLKSDTKFSPFADTAIAAELIYHIDTASSVVNCRRAMEFAVKWMYTVDGDLKMPYQDQLVTLINTDEFKDIVGNDICKRLDILRQLGNIANHTPQKLTRDQSRLALKNLHIFLDFIVYCYGDNYIQTSFNESLLDNQVKEKEIPKPSGDFEKIFEKLKTENQVLKEQLTKLRNLKVKTYVSSSLDMTEAETRKLYIDVMLNAAGWEKDKNWFEEFPIEKMPNKAGIGAADYVLFGDDGNPLAVIEAKRTSVELEKGRQQAKLYADDLERRFKKRPVIFLTNGIKTHIWVDQEGGYPERQVSGIFSKRDLEKEFNKMEMRTSPEKMTINSKITERYYQREAIKAVCEAFEKRRRRKALLVMATGSGKTRTIISLVDILSRCGWVTNFLFLADRNSLVTQAKREFHNHLPNTSITNLVEEKDNPNARGVFSTYQTMMNQIDESTDDEGEPLYTPGHFDLIILDEAHRSIYNKYKDIFTYFDALLVGLTATPKNEIDKNTYEIFDLEAGVPTYGYELKQAVTDGYLVDYTTIETKLKFMQKGIIYDDLSEDEKTEYEEKFVNDDGTIPDIIGENALNEWVFNKDTIQKVLNSLLTKGLKVEYGGKIGKTIIFAKNHLHAEKIYTIWGKEYTNYPPGYCQVIDNYTNYAQSLIDDFSTTNKMPQIAVSVDMLDTGIDIPEILNLVFFKKVMSKAKFWQMIGRGTRLCKGLIDGDDKTEFYIFDFCSNFEFFRENNGKGKEGVTTLSLQAQLFILKAEIIYKLQSFTYQTEGLIQFRDELIKDLLEKIAGLNRDNFAVRQHIFYVDLFGKKETYLALKYEQLNDMEEHILSLLGPENDDFSAVRFDVLMYGNDLAYITGKKYIRGKKDLMKKADALTMYGTIPAVHAQKNFIETLLHTDFFDKGGINEFETIRLKLRDLMKYLDGEKIKRYDTNFKDDVIDITERPPEFETEDLKNYRKKMEYYIRENQNNPVIAKLKTNRPLNSFDIKELEKILWSEAGTKEQYKKEYGEMPLGELVRSVVGLDMQAAKEAFAVFLDNANLDIKQIYFINKVIEYIVQNGMLKDFSVLQGSPFIDKGDITELFTDLVLWNDIKKTIDAINANAIAA
jgi:type I restriction enzyme R subunit